MIWFLRFIRPWWGYKAPIVVHLNVLQTSVIDDVHTETVGSANPTLTVKGDAVLTVKEVL